MNSNDFSILPLPDAMLCNLKELGYREMTPIQAGSLPLILDNRDVIAQAKTGSGKTAAFGIGVLSKLDVKKFRVQSLVLCPTRELADQVAKELRRLARFAHNIKVLTLCGGTAFGPQLGSLRHGAHIVVGTPGRVLQHLEKGSLLLDALETLVLDEADRMLDMGFIEEITKVIDHAPLERQTLLFSATFPDAIMQLCGTVQRDPVTVRTITEERPNRIIERFYGVARDAKLPTLIRILAHFRPERSIVFCNTKIEAREIAESLHRKGIDALAIHGDLEQYERTDVLVQFANRSCSVLVATDVAARGLDIKELEAVVNYDMPQDPEVYTHRIGRTGRAGEEGLAFSLFTGDEALDADAYRDGSRRFEEADELPEAQHFILQPPNVTLVIEGGKKDKVRPGDILGALTGEAGLEGKSVGKIDVYERQSYVAVERAMAARAYERMKNGKIKGRKFSVWVLE